MAERTIKRTNANESAINEAKATAFGGQQFTLPKSTRLIIGETDWVQHTIDGKLSDNATMVLNLWFKNDIKNGKPIEGAKPFVFYPKSTLKQRRDYKGDLIAIEGSFNELLKTFATLTMGEVETKLAELKGRELETTIQFYHKISRLGDVVEVSVNGFNLIS